MTLCEQTFRKMGFEWEKVVTYGNSYSEEIHGTGWAWTNDDSKLHDSQYRASGKPDPEPCVTLLPPIDSQWEVTAKYLVPFMRDRGWGLHISINAESENYFNWGRDDKPPFAVGANIVDFNIAKAACKSFMEVEL